MTSLLLPLAHAGEGATWQALLTLLALGLAAVLVLVILGVLRVDEPGDLILPLAGTAVLASMSGATSTVLSDWVGWAFPLGVVALVALLVAALTPLRLTPTAPLAIAAVALATVGAVVFQGPIVRAWHPVVIALESAPLDDLTLTITAPEAGATLAPGTATVVVAADGGTIGPGVDEATAAAPADPEELVSLTITVVSSDTGENTSFVGVPVGGCQDGCNEATYEVTIDEPGNWSIFVEARTADGRTFARTDGSSGAPTASVAFEVTG